MRVPLPLLLLMPLLPLTACAPRVAAPAALETQVFEGSGSGTFTSAKYRLVLQVNAAAGSASGVFYNQTSGDNYSVTGRVLRTVTGADFNLTLSQSANVAQSANANVGASALGRAVGAGAGAEANAAFGRSAQLTGTLVGKSFNGRLRTVLANYDVKLTRTE